MFRFKQFSVAQDRTPMKVGTDGVLLGAWAQGGPTVRRILDIGTGTGLIAFMLAQRYPQAQVTGLDIADVTQACENAAALPWADRVRMVQCAVQDYRPEERFDLIVSNPPYYVDSLLPPDPGRTTARHATELPFRDLHDAVVRLLTPEGRFCLILPPDESRLFDAACRGLWALRRTQVRSTPRRGVRRVLTAYGTEPCGVPAVDMLTIGTGVPEQYTDEYRALTRDFYLKF